jgi:hypothetical protein
MPRSPPSLRVVPIALTPPGVPVALAALAVPLVVLAGCGTHEDAVCQDIGDCAQGGKSDFIQSCQAESKALKDEARSSGCGGPFDDYFGCADSNFTCQGATATFSGCDGQLQALDHCLQVAEQATSCAALASKESACASLPDGGPPPACTLARDCQAQCYLAQVGDVCAPRVSELDAFTRCVVACPP